MFQKRRAIITITSIFLFVFLGLFVALMIFLRSSIVSDEKGIRYLVQPGASIKSVSQDLYTQKIINHPFLFNMLVYLKGNKHELKAGDYLFRKGTTPLSLFNQITSGTGMFHYTFTIIAGWNFKHLREMLLNEPDLQHTSATLSDAAIMSYLGAPALSPEGRFFPDTFYFVKGSSDLLLLKRSFQKMQNKLNIAWANREVGLPYLTQNEALTVASLIEKETALNKERPIIAGVILNRLKKDMLLQIDPTVIYAAGDHYNGTIYKTELLSNNPYNTYKHKGLPPTPIAIPSMDSINAAMHPQHHNFYYFVVKNNTTEGGHQFSATLAEHNVAVLIARLNQPIEFFNNDLIKSYFLKIVFNSKDGLNAKTTDK